MSDSTVSINNPEDNTDSLEPGTSAIEAQGPARDAEDHQLTYRNDEQGHHDEHHGPSLMLLIIVFAALMILTVVTVGVTVFDFGYQWNLIVAMLIATVKAAIVGYWFMHLKWDPPIFGFILLASLGFVSLFIVFTLLDTGEYMPNIEEQVQTTASES